MSTRLMGPGPAGARPRSWWGVFVPWVALVLLGGCATGHPPGALLSGHGLHSAPSVFHHSAGPRPLALAPALVQAGSGGGFPEPQADAFQVVQESCGLDEESRHPAGAALYMAQARQLQERLHRAPVTQRSFGPHLVFSWLLREALAGGGRVEYAELLRRTERFRPVVVVRPDGYLEAALTGEPLQRLGPVKLEEGEFKVGSLVVGAFYFSHGGVIYPVDDSLRRSGTIPFAELGLGRDWLSAALDGAQDAMGELALALAQSVLHPIRSVGELKQLPTTVALLIASSPEYFARYGAMSLQDQIREAARLSTHLLMMLGGSAGTVGTMGRVGTLGAQLPVLTVTADGLLMVRTVAVSAGAVTTTLETSVGAVAILHMASSGGGNWPPTGGPGRWVEDTSKMSERSRAYQAQVTKAPNGWAYEVCRDGTCVDFDGYDPEDDCLLEAKGEGYEHWFDSDLEHPEFYQGAESMEKQAKRQSMVAGGRRIRWIVAEPRMVTILQKRFESWGITGIEVVYKPPLRRGP
ncbi:MAG: Tox-REase-5 domain-containing protein [Archangium sp.]